MSTENSAASRILREARIEPRTWIGLLAAVIYVAFAGGVANLLLIAFPLESPIASLVLGHVPVLVPLIVAGVVFVRWAGWSEWVWRTPAAFETRPRRWWLFAFPILALIQSTATLIASPWSAWDFGPVLIVAIVFLMVGFGEELYFRGILRAAVRRRHGETFALLLTSIAFGVAHTLGAVAAGADLPAITFEIVITALGGAVYYGVYRATGRLWVPIALHALEDFSLQISSADLTAHPVDVSVGPVGITTQALLWVLTAVLLVSCIRQDLHTRRSSGHLDR